MISPVTIARPGHLIATAAYNSLPVLQTERLTLRVPVLDDFALFHRLFTLPSAKNIDAPVDDDGIWAQFTNYIASWVLRGDGMFSVEHDNTLIGFVFAGVEIGDEAIELGFFIAPEFQKSGFAFEAAQAALTHLQSISTTRIVSYVAPQNLASQRLVEKLGGQKTGRLDGALVFDYPTNKTRNDDPEVSS